MLLMQTILHNKLILISILHYKKKNFLAEIDRVISFWQPVLVFSTCVHIDRKVKELLL